MTFEAHPDCDLTHPASMIACSRCATLWRRDLRAARMYALRNLAALALFVLATAAALLSIPAPNGLPLILAALVLYGLGWHFYNPKENR